MTKGAISIETIIIIILAVLTLVIVAAAFSGGMRELWLKITGLARVYTATTEAEAKNLCETYCISEKEKACGREFYITETNVTKTCRDLGASCCVKS